MKNDTWILSAIVTCGVLALTAVAVGAQSLQPTSETYSWSGEFVGFDANSRTITVKSRVVGEQALTELPQFKSGDRLVLTWSGFDTFADAIARVTRYEANKKWNEPFTFPIEFVVYESPRQYLTFKFLVPVASAEAIKGLKPGEWVTAISRHRASNESEAITSVNAYSATSARPSTN